MTKCLRPFKVVISWALLTVSVVLGNVEVWLKCTVLSDTCCNQRIRKWMKGPNSDLLLQNGAPTIKGFSKYSEKIESDGFVIVIKNFSQEDLNQNYTCAYGFETYSKPLLIAGLELHPENETIVKYFNINDHGRLNINVTFKKVYPVPSCMLYVDGKNESNKLTSEYMNVDIFKSATFAFDNNTCLNNFTMNCSVGQSYVFTMEHPCRNITETKMSANQTILQPESIYIPIIVIIGMVIVCCVCYKRVREKICNFKNLLDKDSTEKENENEEQMNCLEQGK